MDLTIQRESTFDVRLDRHPLEYHCNRSEEWGGRKEVSEQPVSMLFTYSSWETAASFLQTFWGFYGAKPMDTDLQISQNNEGKKLVRMQIAAICMQLEFPIENWGNLHSFLIAVGTPEDKIPPEPKGLFPWCTPPM